jgi:group I intron endonuclease
MSPTEILDNLIKDKYTKEELNSSCGVYILTLHGKHYVGSCKMLNYKMSRNGFHYRLYLHLHKLLNKKHHSLKFQNAVNKYGINNIEFDIIQECDPSLTIYIEQYWLTLLNTFRVGYNSCPTARSNAGYKHTDEAKLKMSKSKSGRQAWNKGLKGPSPSEETRAKLSVIAKGRKLAPMPEERKLAISKKLKEYYNNKYLLTLS